MTGFGRGSAPAGSGRVLVEVRSVNHKYQDLRLSIPPELSDIEGELERTLRSAFARGRVEAVARLEGLSAGRLALDREAARSCLESLEALRDEMGLADPVPLSVLAAVPQIFQPTQPADHVGLVSAALSATALAVKAADAMRLAEGAALARDLEARLGRVEETLGPMRALAAAVAPAALDRLRGRLERLLGTMARQVDEARLAQEAAILADRADVSEELTRLESHIGQFRTIAAEGGAVGRRLEFLLQEMSREASTLGAKAQDAALQHMVVDVRAEIARMREQIHNVE